MSAPTASNVVSLAAFRAKKVGAVAPQETPAASEAEAHKPGWLPGTTVHSIGSKLETLSTHLGVFRDPAAIIANMAVTVREAAVAMYEIEHRMLRAERALAPNWPGLHGVDLAFAIHRGHPPKRLKDERSTQSPKTSKRGRHAKSNKKARA